MEEVELQLLLLQCVVRLVLEIFDEFAECLPLRLDLLLQAHGLSFRRLRHFFQFHSYERGARLLLVHYFQDDIAEIDETLFKLLSCLL